MPYQNPQTFMVSLKILLRNKKGECLIMASPDLAVSFKNCYDLPGGRINDNEVETPFIKLIDREIKEEVGENIKYKLRKDPVALTKYRFKNGDCALYVLFEAKYLNGTIKISGEHTSFCWKKLNKKNIKNIFHPKYARLLKNYFDWNQGIKVKL
ncbi:MAG: hypothetical protein WCX71_00785 [Candidatus Buchananbacteria bacterium]